MGKRQDRWVVDGLQMQFRHTVVAYDFRMGNWQTSQGEKSTIGITFLSFVQEIQGHRTNAMSDCVGVTRALHTEKECLIFPNM